jgi:2-polyprenyl-6-methoxyphenol hydroxylase-like FAD-dependent oxidoreductase
VRTVIIGAGPTGLFTAIALARRGRDVVVVDRDPGPPERGEWHRRGVMQFQHAHSFRGQVVDALYEEMPDVLTALVSAGASVATTSGQNSRAAALHCRRMVFERELWRRAAAEPRLRVVTGNVSDMLVERTRAVGVRIGSNVVNADWSSTHRDARAASPPRCTAVVRAQTVAPPMRVGSIGCARAPNRDRRTR